MYAMDPMQARPDLSLLAEKLSRREIRENAVN